MSLKDAVSDLFDTILNSPKIAVAVPVATSAISTVSVMTQAQSWITIFAGLLGLVVTLLIIRNWHLKNSILEYERDIILKAIGRRKNDTSDT